MATTLNVSDGDGSFVPRVKNQFILRADGMDSFLCRNLRRISDKSSSFEIHENIDPTGSKLVMEWIRSEFENSHVGKEKTVFPTISWVLLDPVGNPISRWDLIEPTISEANFSDNYFNFDSSEPLYITLVVRYTKLEVVY